MASAPTNISSFEEWFVYGLAAMGDLGKLLIGIIPGIDLLGLPMWFAGFLSMNVYFLIRLGPGYLMSGKNPGQKLAVFMSTTAIGFIPVIDDFVPELTLQAVSILGSNRKEVKKYEAANDKAAQKQQLSRAA
jgi:hypothetical protein